MIHQANDKIMKFAIIIFASVILHRLGLKYTITGVQRNEMLNDEGRSLFADMVFTTLEGILIDFEFQDVKITEKNLKKYLEYKVNLQCKYNMPVLTIIICSHHIKTDNLEIFETKSSHFIPVVLYLSDFNKIGIFKTIKNKLINDDELTVDEQSKLLLLPFMYDKKDRGKIVEDICNLLINTNGKNKEIIEKLRLGLIIAIRQYVDEDKKEELERMIKMDIEPEYLVDIEKVTESYNNGMEKGLLKGQKEIISNFINSGVSIEEISRLGNMDIPSIEKILDG